MPKYVVVPTQITDAMVIDFTRYPQDPNFSESLIPLNELETSNELLNFALRQTPYIPFKHTSNGKHNIGYGTENGINSAYNMLESEAYSHWIDKFKTSEREFKKFFPLTALSQNKYDALVSLYHFSGRWDKVGSSVASFNIKSYIENEDWDRVATAMIHNTNGRSRSQAEAKIMMMGNYGRHTPREMLKLKGLRHIKAEYLRLTDNLAKQQCEFVYFVETSRFLPGLTQPRKRQLVDYVNSNNIVKNNIIV
jgi:hypothetical protein